MYIIFLRISAVSNEQYAYYMFVGRRGEGYFSVSSDSKEKYTVFNELAMT